MLNPQKKEFFDYSSLVPVSEVVAPKEFSNISKRSSNRVKEIIKDALVKKYNFTAINAAVKNLEKSYQLSDENKSLLYSLLLFLKKIEIGSIDKLLVAREISNLDLNSSLDIIKHSKLLFEQIPVNEITNPESWLIKSKHICNIATFYK